MGKETGFRNWGHGIVWYIIGIVITINLLENSTFADLPQVDRIKTEYIRVMNWASPFQNKVGMWYSFIDRPETLTDSTAISRIATAIVWGVRLKLLPESYLEKAELASVGLQKYLTTDGFPINVSQISRDGEALQAG